MAKKITGNGKVAAEIAAGLIAAAAAGYYFYGSSKAKNHRKIAAAWATKMKKEVIRDASRLKDISSRDFGKVVDTVADTYRGVRSIDATDLKRAAQELKSNWDIVQREIEKTGKRDLSRAKVVGKATLARTKKTVTKVVKKATTPRSR